MLLEEPTLAFAGAALFMTVDLNQGYWQMTLAANFAGIIHVCDAQGSIHADANAPRSDECNLVLPGSAGEDARRLGSKGLSGVCGWRRHLGMKRLGVDGSLLVGSEETGEGWPVCGCSQS